MRFLANEIHDITHVQEPLYVIKLIILKARGGIWIRRQGNMGYTKKCKLGEEFYIKNTNEHEVLYKTLS